MAIRNVLLVTLCLWTGLAAGAVRLKDLVRPAGGTDHQLLGYGLVVGLGGTGDSERNGATLQSVSNLLREFGLQVPAFSLRTRNTAAVMVTARLGDAYRRGDRFDVTVSALGDARSLAGGTLILTPLLGGDRQPVAEAQGAVSTDGFQFEQDGSSAQKNYPTSGLVPGGGQVQHDRLAAGVGAPADLDLLLIDPDYTTATRIASVLNTSGVEATALDAGRVRVAASADGASRTSLLARIENLSLEPAQRARVVVNARTGTVVAGGDVSISAVTITQGDIRVAISQRNQISQPYGIFRGDNPGVQTVVVPESRVEVTETAPQAVALAEDSTVGELITALRSIRASSADVVAILQGIKRAGALHAELIIE